MTDEQERRHDLAYNLLCARKALAACAEGDVNGRADVLHRIRNIEQQLGPVDEKALADFALRLEEAAVERAKQAAQRRYDKTGVVQS
jgi:hypothetical protein